jgi:hypothetical protein
MCLLHTHHPDTVLGSDWIGDFYWHNPDGVGVMYSETDEAGVPRLRIVKQLLENGEAAVKFYEDHIKGREAIVHWRMQTHGDIDVSQAHPYVVAESLDTDEPLLALMHNGILSCGNPSDKSKSDTWHYNEFFLKPLLNPAHGGDPEFAFKYAFCHILGQAIDDGNKFAFMDDQGRTSIINEGAGVYWRGMWLSNTYAWSAPNHVCKYYRANDKFNDFDDVPETEESMYGDLYENGGREWMYDPKAYTTAKKFVGTTGSTTATVVPLTHGSTASGASYTGALAANPNLVPVGGSRALVPGDDPHELARAYNKSQITSIFRTLRDDGKMEAWHKLSFINFMDFEAATDIDQIWEAVMMCVDDVITEEKLIDYIKNPNIWIANRPRLARANISSGEDALARTRENPWDEDEVIEATLPRTIAQQHTDATRAKASVINDALSRLPDDVPYTEGPTIRTMPEVVNDRPVYDCREA